MLLPLHIRMSQGRMLDCLHDESAEPVFKIEIASVLRSSAFRSQLKPNERSEKQRISSVEEI